MTTQKPNTPLTPPHTLFLIHHSPSLLSLTNPSSYKINIIPLLYSLLLSPPKQPPNKNSIPLILYPSFLILTPPFPPPFHPITPLNPHSFIIHTHPTNLNYSILLIFHKIYNILTYHLSSPLYPYPSLLLTPPLTIPSLPPPPPTLPPFYQQIPPIT